MNKNYISNRGYVIYKENITEKEIIDIRNELTVKPFVLKDYNVDSNIAFPVYLESNRKMYLPKFYGIKRFGNKDIVDKTHEGESIDVKFNGTLRPEQVDVVNTYLDVAHKIGGGIISLGCGSGKTTIALNICSKLGKKTLVVVHKDFLLTQWRERIAQFLPTARVGLIKQSKVQIEDRDIILASLQSLAMREYLDNMLDSIGNVIIDECHHISSEVFSRSLPKIASRYMLGLSATPQRKDGLTKVFEWYLGDIIIERKREVDDTIIVKSVQFHSTNKEYCQEKLNYTGKVNMSGMINNIVDYNVRTECILIYIKELLKENRNILLLTDRLNHIEYIKKCVEERNICDVGKYVGGMKEKDLKSSESCKLILATYSMAAEGMDIPHLDTLILASPRTDIEQSVGRILRKKVEDRTVKPIIVDIVDKFSVFINQGKKRNTYYKKNKYKIVFEDYYADGNNASNITTAYHHNNYDRDDNSEGDNDNDNNMRSLLNKLKFGKCIIKN
jgi:superfamily II DNA or RNA helicase